MKAPARHLQLALVCFALACGDSSGEGARETLSTIGPAGGEVRAGGATLIVPPDALTEDVEIGVAVFDSPPPLPRGTAAGSAITFTPHGTIFTRPATILLPYDGDGDPAAFRLDDEQDDTWEEHPVPAFVMDDQARIDVTGFSVYQAGDIGQGEPDATLTWASDIFVDTARDRLILTGGSVFTLADGDTEPALLQADGGGWHAYAGDELLGMNGVAVSSIDLQTGEWTQRSEFPRPIDYTIEVVAYDPTRDSLVYPAMQVESGVTPTGNFADGVEVSLYTLDVDAGTSSIVSGPQRGAGPPLSMTIGGMVLDAENDRVLLASGVDTVDPTGGVNIRVLAVDLATGDRTVLATGLGDRQGTLPVEYPDGMAYDSASNTAFVGGRNQQTIYRVDLTTGTHVRLEDPTGTVLYPAGLTFDPAPGTLYVIGHTERVNFEYSNPVVVRVDPESGSQTMMWPAP